MRFMPFDPEIEFPGKIIIFDPVSLDNAFIEAWIKAFAPPPDSIDVAFKLMPNSIGLEATTVRNGIITNVFKSLPINKPSIGAIAKHYAYFVRNCPKVIGGTAHEIICRSYLADILRAVPRPAHIYVEEWLKSGNVSRFIIPGELLPGMGIKYLQLIRENPQTVFGWVVLKTGQVLIDSEQGVIFKWTKLPVTLRDGLMKQSLSRIINAPWANKLVVTKPKGTSELLCKSPGIPLPPLGQDEMSHEQAREIINHFMSTDTIKSFDAGLFHLFKDMPLTHKATVMSMCQIHSAFSLRLLGYPEWSLINKDGNLQAAESARMPLSLICD